MKKVFLLFFIFIFFLPIAQADYFFDVSQCECNNGLELTKARRQGNLLDCTYRMEKGKYNRHRTMPVKIRTYIPKGSIERAKKYAQDHYDDFSTSKTGDFRFEDFSISEERVSLIYYQ